MSPPPRAGAPLCAFLLLAEQAYRWAISLRQTDRTAAPECPTLEAIFQAAARARAVLRAAGEAEGEQLAADLREALVRLAMLGGLELPDEPGRALEAWRVVAERLGEVTAAMSHLAHYPALLDALAAHQTTAPQPGPEVGTNSSEALECYVTIDQMAALAGKSKRQMLRWMNGSKDPAPPPDVEGGDGRAHEWRWSRVRPWLARWAKRQLPERFPDVLR